MLLLSPGLSDIFQVNSPFSATLAPEISYSLTSISLSFETGTWSMSVQCIGFKRGGEIDQFYGGKTFFN